MKYTFSSSYSVVSLGKSFIFLGIAVIVAFILSPQLVKENITTFIVLLLLFELPILVLYIQYFINDYRSSLQFSRIADSFNYFKNGNEYQAAFKDIIMIDCIITPGLANDNSISIYPQDGYFYYRFHFTDGKSIVITSLLLKGKLINPANFKEVELRKRVSFMPYL